MPLLPATMNATARPRRNPFDPPPRKPVTLAPITTREISDADIGLPHDPVAQERAERFVRAAIAYRMKQDEEGARKTPVASIQAVAVTVPDDAIHLTAPTDCLSPAEAEILAALHRLVEMRPTRWIC